MYHVFLQLFLKFLLMQWKLYLMIALSFNLVHCILFILWCSIWNLSEHCVMCDWIVCLIQVLKFVCLIEFDSLLFPYCKFYVFRFKEFSVNIFNFNQPYCIWLFYTMNALSKIYFLKFLSLKSLRYYIEFCNSNSLILVDKLDYLFEFHSNQDVWTHLNDIDSCFFCFF